MGTEVSKAMSIITWTWIYQLFTISKLAGLYGGPLLNDPSAATAELSGRPPTPGDRPAPSGLPWVPPFHSGLCPKFSCHLGQVHLRPRRPGPVSGQAMPQRPPPPPAREKCSLAGRSRDSEAQTQALSPLQHKLQASTHPGP